MRATILVAISLATVIYGAGCGTQALSAEQASEVAGIELSFSTTVLNGSSYGETLDGVDYLIHLCREDPGATYDDRTVKQVVEDGANTLREYQPELAAKLDRVLDGECE